MKLKALNICVFCSSSEALHKKYSDMASELGELIGQNGNTLIHGGGKIGLMGVLGRSVKQFGGKVIGIIPEKLNIKGVASETDDEMIVTKDMRDRKAAMHEYADAFITLPGGFGTLEEIMETLTLKQLKYHSKPIVFIDTDNFFQFLFKQFDVLFDEEFTNRDFRNLYYIAATPTDAMTYIKDYKHKDIKDKWL